MKKNIVVHIKIITLSLSAFFFFFLTEMVPAENYAPHFNPKSLEDYQGQFPQPKASG